MIDIANHPTMPVKENVTNILKPGDCGGGGGNSSSSCSIQKPTPKRSSLDMKDVLLKGVASSSSSSGEGEELMLEVTCGQNQAALYMSRLQLGSKGTCVLFDNAWLTPNEFQYISGRETAKDWKRSIKHHGKSLKVLISKGILTTSPLRCNCGQCAQTKDKDGSKYIVGDETKTPNGPVRDSYVTDTTKLGNSDTGKDLPDRRFFRVPVDSNEKLRDVLAETPTKQQRPLTDQCFPGHSQNGAKYLSCDTGLYGALHDTSFRFDRQEGPEGFSMTGACTTQTAHMPKCTDVTGHDPHKSTSDCAETKQKTKRKSDGTETGDYSKNQVELHCMQNGDHRKYTTEANKSDSTESGQKKFGSSVVRPTSGAAAGSWSHGCAGQQMEQSHHLEPSGSKAATHEKAKKLTNSPASTSSLERPSCNQLNVSPSGKNSHTNSASCVNPRLASSESSFMFPSFGSPYYPMITGPQLPAYYPNPYMWPVPFPANPATCSYGWTAPPDMNTPSCLRSPNKESLDCNPSTVDQAFNFPWMKHSNYCSLESQSCRGAAGDSMASGKRKLETDASDYFPPSKHPFYLSDSLRPAFGDAVWPAYSPAAAAALDFRFLPYSLPSYIPDGRAAHGMFPSNFLKGSENPAVGGLGLYPGLFSSPCLGVNSR